MKLRVPDFYSQFSCIADKCKDSCCRGWEVDVDEDSQEYYASTEGKMGEWLKSVTYQNEDGSYGFTLTPEHRCPFLNKNNLCDMYINMGEESLCEVCTDFPRFGISYCNSKEFINQKFLSLACEEAGRILFAKEDSMEFVDIEQPGHNYIEEDEEIIQVADFVEKVQWEAIEILKDSSISIWERMKKYLLFINEKHFELNDAQMADEFNVNTVRELKYEDFRDRSEIMTGLDEVAYNWEQEKNSLLNDFTEENYEEKINEFLESHAYRELDYEQLMIYFTFRYMMNAIYDDDLISYGKLAVVFTLLVRDMDAIRLSRNGEYSREDRVDVCRIFSKEVEHAEENIEAAKDAFMFDEVFRIENLLKQI